MNNQLAVIKRDLSREPFNVRKIGMAIKKAGLEDKYITNVLESVQLGLLGNGDIITIEQIQDVVEKNLPMEIRTKYQEYRKNRKEQRERLREEHKSIRNLISDRNNESLKENANMHLLSPSGMHSKLSDDVAGRFSLTELIKPHLAKLHTKGYIHVHDNTWYFTRSTTCVQHDLKSLQTGNKSFRPAKSLRSAFELAVCQLQNIQCVQHGGQAIPSIDHQLAPFVRKEFDRVWELIYQTNPPQVEIEDYMDIQEEDPDIRRVVRIVKTNCLQMAEGFIHNLNTLKARTGNQVPFSSVNLGTDISPEGRLITYSLLKGIDEGVGPMKKTAIFPIIIFKLLKAVNGKGKPNYDLRRYAIKVMAHRHFPKFINLDNGFNLGEKWDLNDKNRWKYECDTMGW